MGQAYRYKRSIEQSYEEQGYIYFLSRRYTRLSPWKKERIDRHCREVAGGEAAYEKGLRAFVLEGKGETEVCMRHNLSESTLRRLVQKYYETFPQGM